MRLFSSWTSDDFVRRMTLLQAFTVFALAIICFSSIGILPSSAVWQKVGGWAGVIGGGVVLGVGIAGLGAASPAWLPVAGVVGCAVGIIGGGAALIDAYSDNCNDCDGSGYHEDGDNCLTCNPPDADGCPDCDGRGCSTCATPETCLICEETFYSKEAEATKSLSS